MSGLCGKYDRRRGLRPPGPPSGLVLLPCPAPVAGAGPEPGPCPGAPGEGMIQRILEYLGTAQRGDETQTYAVGVHMSEIGDSTRVRSNV